MATYEATHSEVKEQISRTEQTEYEAELPASASSEQCYSTTDLQKRYAAVRQKAGVAKTSLAKIESRLRSVELLTPLGQCLLRLEHTQETSPVNKKENQDE